MRWHALLAGPLALLAAGTAPADDKGAAKKDLERMTGTWVVVHAESDGKELPADELKKMKLVQEGAKWTFSGGDEEVGGVDTLDPGRNPKAVDSKLTRGRDK